MILDRLREGRNVGANLALELDRNRGYVNNQLSKLASLGLVRRVGPSENGGLYELTEKGALAAASRELYEDDSIDFESALEERLGNAQSVESPQQGR